MVSVFVHELNHISPLSAAQIYILHSIEKFTFQNTAGYLIGLINSIY